MKVIDKKALKQLIDDLKIEDIQITEPFSDIIDTSTLAEGRTHMIQKEGLVKITIAGRVEKPEQEL
jgi:hypothetical protein